MMNYLDTLRKAIRSHMKENSLSMRKFSEEAGFNEDYLKNILNKRTHSPTLESVIKIAHYLNITVSELIGESDSRLNDEFIENEKERILEAAVMSFSQLEEFDVLIEMIKKDPERVGQIIANNYANFTKRYDFIHNSSSENHQNAS